MAKPTENKTALGIALDIEDETTGVPASFHTVGTLYLDFASGYHTATIQSYFSKRVYELGKQPVGGGTQISLTGQPPRDADIVDWVLQSVTASDAQGSRLRGGGIGLRRPVRRKGRISRRPSECVCERFRRPFYPNT